MCILLIFCFDFLGVFEVYLFFSIVCKDIILVLLFFLGYLYRGNIFQNFLVWVYSSTLLFNKSDIILDLKLFVDNLLCSEFIREVGIIVGFFFWSECCVGLIFVVFLLKEEDYG